MIACGWCGQPTEPGRCTSCQRDPALAWLQRGQAPLAFDRLAGAIKALGANATTEAIAEFLGVDARTVRRWRADVRPTS